MTLSVARRLFPPAEVAARINLSAADAARALLVQGPTIPPRRSMNNR
jgi:hypothetical protein